MHFTYITVLFKNCFFFPLAESPIIEESLQSIVVGEGKSESVSFSCVVTGTPSLRVSWFNIMGLEIGNFSNYNINESWEMSENRVKSTLTIHHPTYEDSGQYTCLSTILNGKDREDFRTEKNVTLTVLGEKLTCSTHMSEF